MSAETSASWFVDGHMFTARADLDEDGTLTLSLSVPLVFLAEATSAQRLLYAQRRDVALGDLADVLSQQACSDHEPAHKPLHH